MTKNRTWKVVLTGGAGFIGSHLLDELIRVGLGTSDLASDLRSALGFQRMEIHVVDNFLTGKRENLDDVLSAYDAADLARQGITVEIHEADIRDRSTLRDILQGAHHILHQAALPSVQKSVERPLDTDSINVHGTLTLLELAKDQGIQRVVFASSSSVYGDTPTLPKHEEMPPAPLSPYAVSKLTGEYYCKVYAHIHGLSTVILRYFNVFGPRQDPTSQYAAVIPKFITHALEGKPLPVFGDGTQSRDFTYVSNVVRGNLLALIRPHIDGRVYNIATGKRIHLNELIETLRRLLPDRTLEVTYLPPRKGDIKHSLASIERARSDLGYEPVVSFEEGLERTLAWYKQRR